MDSIQTVHILMIAAFVVGYVFIVFEHRFGVNKGATALLLAGTLWTLYFVGVAPDLHTATHALERHLAEVSQIIFFLLGAMTLVEVIDSHGSFRLVTDMIRTRSKRRIMWILAVLAFFMSALLDNLTTTIVMVSLLRRILPDRENRILLGSMVVIAANAGGAWTPMGDVTTSMLWIGGQVSTLGVITALAIPSVVTMVVAVLLLGLGQRGHYGGESEENSQKVEVGARRVLALGLGAFIFVPVFKTLTHLPPFVGVLIGLGVMWVVTDVVHRHSDECREHVKVPYAFTKIDVSGVLFFLGILLAIGALASAGLLTVLATGLNDMTSSPEVLAGTIGILSAIVDNVPLVAASMAMYPMESFPADGQFWHLIAFCAGTGGSILIVGSAAGVALMGMEKIDFVWYFKRISLIALISYIAGMFTFICITALGLI